MVERLLFEPGKDPRTHFEIGGNADFRGPVAFIRALLPGTVMALDLFVDGLKAKAHKTAGLLWIDLCDRDPRNNPDKDQRRMRIGIGPHGVHIGSSKQENAPTCPVELRVDDEEVARLTSRGLETSLFLGLGKNVPVCAINEGAVKTSRTLFRVNGPILHTIEGGDDGDAVMFRAWKSPVTIQHNKGNISNASEADYTVTSTSQMLLYVKESDGLWRGGKLVS